MLYHQFSRFSGAKSSCGMCQNFVLLLQREEDMTLIQHRNQLKQGIFHVAERLKSSGD